MTLLCLLLLVAGCALGKDKAGTADPSTAAPAASATLAGGESQDSVESLYNSAARDLDKGRYAAAARGFEAVEREYPYSQWATRAQLMAGYAHYKNLKYDEAVLALEHFLDLHPGDSNAPYAWYLKALCFYEQISDVRRDQRMTELALDNLRQVVERYPESRYAKDAALKIDLTRDHLAGKEMEIGRYYLERAQYQAAINRFQRVVEQYQTTTHVPEALHRIVEAYVSLGITEEARKTAAILGHNFPRSQWYRDTWRLLNGAVAEGGGKKGFLGKIF